MTADPPPVLFPQAGGFLSHGSVEMRAPDAPADEILQAALQYRERGWRVFPCHPATKQPVTGRGLHDATTDEATIRDWFTRWPGAMIGCRTGVESGIWVLDRDVDAEKGIDGMAAFKALADGKEPLPDTNTNKTPRGGVHSIFKWIDGIKNSTSKLAHGVDTRGTGGYFILPPSRRSDGKYYETLVACEPSEAPQWLVELVVADKPATESVATDNNTDRELAAFAAAAARHRRAGNGAGYGAAALDAECARVTGAPPGQRNHTLNAAAFNLGQLVAGGVLNESVVRLRLHDACAGNGLVKDDGAAAVLATLNSGLGAGMRTPRGVPPPCSLSSPPSSLPPLQSSQSLQTSSKAETPTRAATEIMPLPFVNMRAWDETPPPREWAVLDRIPLRQVTLLSGEGSVGKSILLLQLSAAHVLAKDWLGAMPDPGPALYLGAEDEEAELHRRLADIAKHYGTRVSELAEHLHVVCLAGQDAVLGHPDRNGQVQPTKLFSRLKQAACDIKPKLISLDTASDIFGGEENNRSQVRQLVGMLRGMAIAANAAVVVASHPSLTEISSGTGLSGSTAWHNSVRARMYFKPAATDAGETPDEDMRELEFKKISTVRKDKRSWCAGAMACSSRNPAKDRSSNWRGTRKQTSYSSSCSSASTSRAATHRTPRHPTPMPRPCSPPTPKGRASAGSWRTPWTGCSPPTRSRLRNTAAENGEG